MTPYLPHDRLSHRAEVEIKTAIKEARLVSHGADFSARKQDVIEELHLKLISSVKHTVSIDSLQYSEGDLLPETAQPQILECLHYLLPKLSFQ